MILGAPKFSDKTGFFPNQNIDSEFHALNEGLKALRRKLGDGAFQKAVKLSQQARACFDADPADNTENGI